MRPTTPRSGPTASAARHGAALRRFFKVDKQSIAVAVLTELARQREVKPDIVRGAFDRYRLYDFTATTAAEAGGET